MKKDKNPEKFGLEDFKKFTEESNESSEEESKQGKQKTSTSTRNTNTKNSSKKKKKKSSAHFFAPGHVNNNFNIQNLSDNKGDPDPFSDLNEFKKQKQKQFSIINQIAKKFKDKKKGPSIPVGFKPYSNIVKTQRSNTNLKETCLNTGIQEIYNKIIDIYSHANHITTGFKSFNPHRTLTQFIDPFNRFIFEAMKNSENSEESEAIYNYLLNLLVIAKAHQTMLKHLVDTYKKPDSITVARLQYYINKHLLHALVTFYNDTLSTKNSEFKKTFTTIKNNLALISENEVTRSNLDDYYLKLMEQNIIYTPGMREHLNGKKRKYCNKIKNLNIVFSEGAKKINSAPNLNNFQEDEGIKLNPPKKSIKKPQEDYKKELEIFHKYNKIIEHYENSNNKKNNNNSGITFTVVNNLTELKEEPSVYEKIGEPLEIKSLPIILYNKIIKENNANNDSKYFNFSSVITGEKQESLKRKNRNPIAGLVHFILPFKALLKANEIDIKAIDPIKQYCEDIFSLTQSVKHHLEEYADYQSNLISANIVGFYNMLGLKAAVRLYHRLNKLGLHNQKPFKKILTNIKKKVLVGRGYRKYISTMELNRKVEENFSDTKIFIKFDFTCSISSIITEYLLEEIEISCMNNSEYDNSSFFDVMEHISSPTTFENSSYNLDIHSCIDHIKKQAKQELNRRILGIQNTKKTKNNPGVYGEKEFLEDGSFEDTTKNQKKSFSPFSSIKTTLSEKKKKLKRKINQENLNLTNIEDYNTVTEAASETYKSTNSEIKEQILDHYNKLVKLYTKADYVTFPIGHNQLFSYDPMSTLSKFIHPFQRFFHDAIQAEKSSSKYRYFDTAINHYLVNLGIIAKAHQDILTTIKPNNPSPALLQALQAYINEHLFYALITFRNEVATIAETEKQKYPALEEAFGTLKNSLLFVSKGHKQIKNPRLYENELKKGIIILQARAGRLGAKNHKKGGDIKKLCARPRSNPREDLKGQKLYKDEATYYVNKIKGAPILKDFKNGDHCKNVEIQASKFSRKSQLPREQRIYNAYLKKINQYKKKTKFKERKPNRNNIPTNTNLKLPSVIQNKTTTEFAPMRLYNIIIETYKENKNSEYFCLIEPGEKEEKNQVDKKYQNPLFGLAHFASSFAKILNKLSNNSIILHKDLHKHHAAISCIENYFSEILQLIHLVKHDLDKYKHYGSNLISLNITYFYNSKGLHAAIDLYKQLRKLDVHKGNNLKPVLANIRDKICIFRKERTTRRETAIYEKLARNRPILIKANNIEDSRSKLGRSTNSNKGYKFINNGESNLGFFTKVHYHIEESNTALENSYPFRDIESTITSKDSELKNKLRNEIRKDYDEIFKEKKINHSLNKNNLCNEKNKQEEKEQPKNKEEEHALLKELKLIN